MLQCRQGHPVSIMMIESKVTNSCCMGIAAELEVSNEKRAAAEERAACLESALREAQDRLAEVHCSVKSGPSPLRCTICGVVCPSLRLCCFLTVPVSISPD